MAAAASEKIEKALAKVEGAIVGDEENYKATTSAGTNGRLMQARWGWRRAGGRGVAKGR